MMKTRKFNCLRYYLALFLILIVSKKSVEINHDELLYSDFVVWGPGLSSEPNLPVRYFYVQAVDYKKEK